MISYETSHPVDLPGGRAVRVARRLRVPRNLLGREADRIGKLTALRISGGDGLPRAAAAFFRGLAGGLDDGTITAG